MNKNLIKHRDTEAQRKTKKYFKDIVVFKLSVSVPQWLKSLNKKVVIKALVLALGLSLIAIFAHALDYPHTNYPSTLTKIINCADCHFTHGTAPWDTSPNNIDETFYNNLCLGQCHEGVTATDVETHSSLQTDNSYGDWTIQCWECHDAHVHEQPDAYIPDSYLDSGTSEAITDLNQITKTGAGWTTDQFAGMMVIPDTSNDYYVYQIISNTADPDNTLTVNGPMNLTLGNTYNFAIFYGRLVRSTIDAPDISTCSVVANEFVCTTYTPQTVRFFRNTGTNSFADGDATYDGVCEVCHTQTTYHKDDGTGASHNAGVDCTTCHTHLTGFKGAGPCLDCHNSAQGTRRQIVGGTSGSAGDDFIRPSRHVSDGTTTNEIVTNFDCIVCHAEGDNTSSSTTIIGTTSVHEDTKVSLRNVDSSANPGTLNIDYWQWPGSGTATSTDRDNMDSFCMNCHDSAGASAIVVNNNLPADGLLTGVAVTGNRLDAAGGDTGRAINLRPFNRNDNLRNANDDSWPGSGATPTIGDFRANTYGRVLNVKDQFNSGNVVGKLWASHHNLNQFTNLRYTTRDTTALPDTAWTTYTTKEGVSLQDAVNGGETVGLHCSDCHLNEVNAHGSRSSWYMLVGKSTASDDDVAPTTDTPASSGDEIMCYRCHSSDVYGTDASSPTVVRYDHSGDCVTRVGKTDKTETRWAHSFGITCTGCHGGFSTNQDGTFSRGGLGAIHGTNEDYYPAYGSVVSKRYRFMSGGSMRFYDPDKGVEPYAGEAEWETSGEQSQCYTIAAADTWGSCVKHSDGKNTNTFTIPRQLEY